MMQDFIETKIKEASNILKLLGLPDEHIKRVSALTFLALCNIKFGNEWSEAIRRSMTLSNDIMDFVNREYRMDYKPNTRESFRKLALKPFVDYGIADLNPDNPNLSTTSSNTHYAITEGALETIHKFGTSDWESSAAEFRWNAAEKRINIKEQKNQSVDVFARRIHIKNFKSIVDEKIDLGRLNVFIGANGSGKTNILEALAFVGASKANDLNFDGLFSRGVRTARPNLLISSFRNYEHVKSIDIELSLEIDSNGLQEYRTSVLPANPNDVNSNWYDLAKEEYAPETILNYMSEVLTEKPGLEGKALLYEVNKMLADKGLEVKRVFDEVLKDYAIYDLNTKSLRGITPAESRKTPLGLNGEGLDLVIQSFKAPQMSQLTTCFELFDWLSGISSDSEDKLKLEGLKAGKSTSTLYFQDHFMADYNNILSAENSNEGILHVLFYLALFISNRTPKLFAIDNIETALNPRLCRVLIKKLVQLSEANNKQVLITTQNPAILDGLNLLDDGQRLFEVYRNDEGHTKTNRIRFKSDLSDKKFKLSQMWLSGALGAVPKNF